MESVRGNVPLNQITRVGNNRLDKPFRVGHRVILNAKGVEIYGHYPAFVLGRQGTIVDIPQERWNNNCVTVQWDDEPERLAMLGCWSFDFAEVPSPGECAPPNSAP